MHRHNHSWRELSPRPLAHHQCSTPEQQELGVCLFVLLEVGDKQVESCRIRKCIWGIWGERALRRIKVGRHLLTFQSQNLVHLRRKLMNELCQSFLIKASAFLSNSLHYSSNCLWARRTKYSLSRSMGQKSSIFGETREDEMWRSRWRVGVRFLLVHRFFGVAFWEHFFRCITSKI